MHDIAETMVEQLEKDPDAAVLVTIDDLDEDADPTLSLYARHDEREKLARRLLALRTGVMVGKHFPNETAAGAVSMVGGSVSYNGAYRDPEIDWKKHHDNEEDDPPELSEVE